MHLSRRAVLDVKLSAVLGEQNRVVGKAYYLPLAEHFLDGILNGAARFRVHDVEDKIHGLPASFLQAPPGEGLGDGIHKDHAAIHVGGNYRVADAGESGREPIFTFCQSFLRPFAFGQLVEQDYENQREQHYAQKIAGYD